MTASFMIIEQAMWQQPSTDHMLETSVKTELYLNKNYRGFFIMKRKETMLWDDSDTNHMKACKYPAETGSLI